MTCFSVLCRGPLLMEISELQLSVIKRTRVLIVDDLPENLQMLGTTLRMQGFQIAFSTSGKQALTIAAIKKPHLILLDMSMPEMDGLTVCKKLKENPETKNIPVIFLTARIETENIMKALSAGAVDYVVKPFNMQQLISRIMTHLGMDKIASISPEERDKYYYSSISAQLENEYMPRWSMIKNSMFIDDVISFAQTITSFGEMHNLKQLKDYGEDLSEAATGIKIEKMNEILDQFPLLIQKLSK